MKRKTKETVALLLSLVILAGGCRYISRMFMPDRTFYGAGWSMYRQEKRDSVDVMFVGSSFVYCDVIPGKLYADTGRTSYVVSAPVCTVATSYYYIREALRTQSPKQIFLEVSSMFFDEYSQYADVAVGYMPWGVNRLGAIFASAAPESRFGLLFPPYSYHQRWQEMELPAFFKRGDETPDPWAGYMYLKEAKPMELAQAETVELESISFEKNCRYLQKIVELCKDRSISLICFMSPSCRPYGEAELELIREQLGDAGLRDFNEDLEEIGLDLTADFYDERHLNFSGAMKFSAFLAEEYGESWQSLPRRDFDGELWSARADKILNPDGGDA